MDKLRELYKKKDKLNMKIRLLVDKLVKINEEIYKLEVEKEFQANQLLIDSEFNIRDSCV